VETYGLIGGLASKPQVNQGSPYLEQSDLLNPKGGLNVNVKITTIDNEN
jgi:hypothetical protein